MAPSFLSGFLFQVFIWLPWFYCHPLPSPWSHQNHQSKMSIRSTTSLLKTSQWLRSLSAWYIQVSSLHLAPSSLAFMSQQNCQFLKQTSFMISIWCNLCFLLNTHHFIVSPFVLITVLLLMENILIIYLLWVCCWWCSEWDTLKYGSLAYWIY